MVSVLLALAAVLVGVAIGVVLQKSKLCHASMLSDFFLFRSLSPNGKGLLIATGLTMLAWSLSFALRGPTGFWLPAWGWYGIVGGAIFGVGMIAASGCMMSALYRAGTGDVQYLLTLLWTGVGYLAYGLLYPVFLEGYFSPLWLGSGDTLFALGPVPAPVLALAVVLLGLVAYAWVEGRSTLRFGGDVAMADGGEVEPASPTGGVGTRRALATGLGNAGRGARRHLSKMRHPGSLRAVVTSRWDPRSGGIALAALAALWLAIHGVWTVSGPEAGWVALLADSAGLQTAALDRWEQAMFGAGGLQVSPNMLVIAGAGLGAVLAALVSGEFGIRWPARETLPHACGGGFLMGVGASLAPGCNIGNLFTGLAQLSLHGGVASVGMIAGAYLATRWLF